MKKVLLIGLTSLLLGCGVSTSEFTKGNKILSIKQKDNGTCMYEVYYCKSEFNILNSINSYFVDSCGKYNVGDTVIVVKK